MSDFESGFKTWLRSHQPILDRACANALRDGLAGLDAHIFERASASVGLMHSSPTRMPEDCNYSLQGIGAIYTGEWHGKRVHDALATLLPLRLMLAREGSTVLDVGAGTGATLWAWALLALYSKTVRSEAMPIVRWISVDSSSEMLSQSDRLWKSLCVELPSVSSVLDRSPPECSDWRQYAKKHPASSVVASYLFSFLDGKDRRTTSQEFADLVLRIDAYCVVTWTRHNTPKAGIVEHLAGYLKDWAVIPDLSLFHSPLNGQMSNCVAAIETHCKSISLDAQPRWREQFTWGGGRAEIALAALQRRLL